MPPTPAPFTTMVHEAVAGRAHVIFAQSMDIAKVAQSVTSTVPIVTAGREDPVKNGLAASLARPGGNVTGMTFMSPQLAAKRLELLREALPGLRRAGIVNW